jgi:thymidylate synthase (FAD)
MKNKIDLYGDGIGCVELIDNMGSDLTIVNAARVSFGKEKKALDEKDRKLIKYLAKHKHTSTFEHNVATFRFVVPLFVRSQHHRHRTWSYNEISRRYTDENLRFYEPKSFRTQHDSNRQASNADDLSDPVIEPKRINGGNSASYLVRDHNAKSLRLYNKLMSAGVCREQARGVLPQNMYTEYYGTCNLNNLIKFIDLRIHEGAQVEIQRVAEAVLELATELWPVAVESYREVRNL